MADSDVGKLAVVWLPEGREIVGELVEELGSGVIVVRCISDDDEQSETTWRIPIHTVVAFGIVHARAETAP